MMKLHHKKHAENLKQYLEWKSSQVKHNNKQKDEVKKEIKLKSEADMALQNSII